LGNGMPAASWRRPSRTAVRAACGGSRPPAATVRSVAGLIFWRPGAGRRRFRTLSHACLDLRNLTRGSSPFRDRDTPGALPAHRNSSFQPVVGPGGRRSRSCLPSVRPSRADAGRGRCARRVLGRLAGTCTTTVQAVEEACLLLAGAACAQDVSTASARAAGDSARLTDGPSPWFVRVAP